MVTVALDAMGGDKAPAEQVAGAAQISLDPQSAHVILVGDERKIAAELAKVRHDAERITIEHTPHVVPMDASPKHALDALPDASVAVTARLVKEGRAQAMVS